VLQTVYLGARQVDVQIRGFGGYEILGAQRGSVFRADRGEALIMGLDRAMTHRQFQWYVVGNLAL